MKTIRINIPLTITHEAQDTVTEPIGLGSLFTHGSFFVRRTIYAMAGSVRVTIVGDQRAVQEMLAEQKNNPTALIQRALSALGYVVGDHKKDVEQFSRWVDHLATFSRSEEALALWTSAMLARLNSAEPPMIAGTIDEASDAALRVVVQRMRLFPPVPKTGLDSSPPIAWDRIKIVGMDLGTEAWSELQEWRTAAKQRGWDTPLAMRGHSALDDAELVAWRAAAKASGFSSFAELLSMGSASFGQFVDKKIVAEWQAETGCQTPVDVAHKIARLSGIVKAREEWLSIWQSETGCMHASGAGELIKKLRSQVEQFEQRERVWCDATNRTCPGDADQRIEDLQLQTKMQAETIRQWQAATERQAPDLAKTHISQLENRNAGLLRDIAAWQKATGASDPDSAIDRARADLDAWQEATGAANSHAAYKRIQELEAKLLSYASEIDALRKANTQPLVSDTVSGREHAKVKAELDSKRRECQTEKERADAMDRDRHTERSRADENARTMTARGVLLDKIADALGVDFNHDSLPEHVADLKRAYGKIEDALIGPDDLANETKEIDAIIWAHVKSAGVASVASSIAGRSVHLSASWAKTMQARDILLASPGEGIVDVAKRVMDRCANLEQQIIADDNRIDELRKILRAKEGESIVDAAKRSFVPLPKPEKVEAGQRWARINSISFVGWWGVIERATIGGEQPMTLELRSNSDWVYLGT